jgi:valyl-tRNA synthetase
LEIIKPAYGQPIDKKTYEATLSFFESLLKLLHPFMPFITEELWQALEERNNGESIMISSMPGTKEVQEAESKKQKDIIIGFEQIKEIIANIRTIRTQKNIPNKESLRLQIIGEHHPVYHPVLMKIASLSAIEVAGEKTAGAVSFLVKTTEFAVPLENSINKEEERAKLLEELKYQQGFLASVRNKLSNENFVSKAPAKIIENERKKQADAESKIKSLQENIANL